MKLISVIVPVYNVEKYLDECIISIINQTYKNLEIILVDDGSTDNSLSICKKYASKDSRIKVIHKENGGLSSARNAGLEVATGEYLMFSDSDDFFFNNSCELLVNEIENKNADYVIGNYQYCDEDGTLWQTPVFDKEKFSNFRLDIKDCKNSFYIMNSSVCNKIFRTQFIKSLNIKFIEKLPAEDAMFSTYCFIKSKSVYYINDVIYAYRQRAELSSISTNCSFNYFNGINDAYKIIYNNFKENNELNFYRFFYAKSMNYIFYKFTDSTILTNEERLKTLSNMSWFYKLSKDLMVPPTSEFLALFIENVIDENYDNALKICDEIYNFRKNLTPEEKNTMSKPSPELYNKLLRNEELVNE